MEDELLSFVQKIFPCHLLLLIDPYMLLPTLPVLGTYESQFLVCQFNDVIHAKCGIVLSNPNFYGGPY
jgi:hypothetical protein